MPDELKHTTLVTGMLEETVKIESNSRGFTYEVKAPTTKRALEMLDELKAELDKRLPPK